MRREVENAAAPAGPTGQLPLPGSGGARAGGKEHGQGDGGPQQAEAHPHPKERCECSPLVTCRSSCLASLQPVCTRTVSLNVCVLCRILQKVYGKCEHGRQKIYCRECGSQGNLPPQPQRVQRLQGQGALRAQSPPNYVRALPCRLRACVCAPLHFHATPNFKQMLMLCCMEC